MTARLLVTGATGLLGRALMADLDDGFELWPVGGQRRPVHPNGAQIDLMRPGDVAAVLARVRPDAVLHLAACANVDLCEAEPDRAYRDNVQATRNLVEAAAALPETPHLIYVSTDQVYDAPGSNDEDAVRPRNVYALTKLWGEDLCRGLPSSVILRLNFFAADAEEGRGLAAWLMRSLRSGTAVQLFSDVMFNPIYAGHIGAVLRQIIAARCTGTYNLGASGGVVSKAAFAYQLARVLDLPTDNCREVSVESAALPAYRPRGMGMDVSRLEAVLGCRLPDIAAGLKDLRSDLQASGGRRRAGAETH